MTSKLFYNFDQCHLTLSIFIQLMKSLFHDVDSQLKNSSVFTNLSSFIKDIDDNQDFLSFDQNQRLQELTNSLTENAMKIILSKEDSSVLQLISQAVSKISKASFNQMKTVASPRIALDSKNYSYPKNNNGQNESESDDLISRIAEELNIEGAANSDNVIQTIHNNANELNELKKMKEDLIETFDLPKSTHTEFAVTFLKNKFSEFIDHQDDKSSQESNNQKLQQQLSEYKEDLKKAQEQMASLQKDIESKNLTIQQYKKSDIDEESDAVTVKMDYVRLKSNFNFLKADYEELSNSYDKLQAQKDELEKLNNTLSQKNEKLGQKLQQAQQIIQNQIEANEKLASQKSKKLSSEQMHVLDELVKQYENQSEELLNEANLRVVLLDAIQKSSSLNEIYEKRLMASEARVEQLQKINEIISSKQKNSPNKTNQQDSDFNVPSEAESEQSSHSEKVYEDLIDNIKTSLSSLPNELQSNVIGICNNLDLTLSKRILSVISALTGAIYQKENYREVNDQNSKHSSEREQLLIDTIGSLFNFINKTASTQEVQNWVLRKYEFKDAAELMSNQVKQIDDFIKQNCIEIKEDPVNSNINIFNAFIENNDPFSLEADMRDFLKRYDDVHTNEGIELLILLHQALAAAVLIKIYSLHASMQCDIQGKELQSLLQRLQETRQMSEKDRQSLQQDLSATKEELLHLQEYLSKRNPNSSINKDYSKSKSPNNSKQNNSQSKSKQKVDESKSTENEAQKKKSTEKSEKAGKHQSIYPEKQTLKKGNNKQTPNKKQPNEVQNIEEENDEDADDEEQNEADEEYHNDDNRSGQQNTQEKVQERVIDLDASEASLLLNEQYIHEMQNQLEKSRKEFKDQKEQIKKYRSTIRSVKTALRREFLNGNQAPVILESFNAMNALDNNDENQNEVTANVIQEIQELNQKLEEKEKVIQEAEKINLELKNQLEIANKELDKAEKRADDSDKRLKETKDFINPRISELQKKIDDTTKEYERKLNEKIEENNQLKDLLQKMKQKVTDKFQQVKENHNKSKSLLKENWRKLKEQYDEKIQELNDEINLLKLQKDDVDRELKIHRSTTNDQNEQNQAEVESLREKIKMLQIEIKMANSKLAGKEEELKREKSIQDSHWRLKQYGLQASAQSQIESYKLENEEKTNKFLIAVCNLFKEYVDVKKSLTYSSVYSMLQQVAKLLNSFSHSVNEVDKIKSTVPLSLSPSNSPDRGNDQNLSQSVIVAFNQNKAMKDQLEQLYNENLNYKKQIKAKDTALISRATTKEWEQWAIPFYKKLSLMSTSKFNTSSSTQPTQFLLRSVLGDALRAYLMMSGEDIQQKKQPDRPMLHLSMVIISAIRLQRMIHGIENDPKKKKYRANVHRPQNTNQ